MADPRFAGWAAGSRAPAHSASGEDSGKPVDLGPLAQEAPPDVALRMTEQRELLRIAYQAAIDRHEAGQFVEREHLAQARQFVAANKPLGRPLSTGEPK